MLKCTITRLRKLGVITIILGLITFLIPGFGGTCYSINTFKYIFDKNFYILKHGYLIQVFTMEEKQYKALYALVVVLGLLAVISIVSSSLSLHKLTSIEDELKDLTGSISSMQTSINELSNKVVKINGTISLYKSELSSLSTSFSKNITQLEVMIEESHYPIQIRDAMGRIVVITHKPNRIVSTAPSITEILFTIGAGKLVVGVDDYSNYPTIVPKLVNEGKIARVGGFADINIEKVLSLKPDLVIGTTGVQFKFLHRLSEMGVTTLSLSSSSLTDVYADILLLGRITGHMNESIDLVEQLKNNITRIYMLTENTTRPTLLYVVWINPFYVAGGKSWFNDLIQLSGGKNAMENITVEWPSISLEEILKANPDVILLSEHAGGFVNAEQALKWLQSQPGGENLSAVKNNRIYMLHGELNDIASRPGPRIYVLQKTLAIILHPDLFGLKNVPNDLYIENITSITTG
jgi:iron complex transport system substrate-binding protein